MEDQQAIQRNLEAAAALIDQLCAPAEPFNDPKLDAVLRSVREQFEDDAEPA